MTTTQVKERPILFSGEMVRAILEGRKTQTRRPVDFERSSRVDGASHSCFDAAGYDVFKRETHSSERIPWTGETITSMLRCPYGKPGDRLWVRETWVHIFPEANGPLEYRADHGDESRVTGGWRPSIYMPRWASRILLEVEEVRVERVQEIGIGNINAEGVACSNCWTANTPYIELPHGENCKCDAKFINIWDSINAKRGYGWDANPWVWVVEFRRVEL